MNITIELINWVLKGLILLVVGWILFVKYLRRPLKEKLTRKQRLEKRR